MMWLLLGAFILFILLGGLKAFERASVASIKALLVWTAALSGLALAGILVLSGRGGAAIGALVMFGPLILQKIRAARLQASAQRPGAGTSAGNGTAGANPHGGSWGARKSGGPLSRQEAYEILGLKPGASEVEIKAAHHRLMRSAHPDVGGSEWLATRVNQARDVLLG
jgi:DnaJ homolog subfamily C member 19